MIHTRRRIHVLLFPCILWILYQEPRTFSTFYPTTTTSIFHETHTANVPKERVGLVQAADPLHLLSTSSPSQPQQQESSYCDDISSTRIPKPYEYSINFDLPSISYLKLRREMLADQSDFWIHTVMSKALQYTQ